MLEARARRRLHWLRDGDGPKRIPRAAAHIAVALIRGEHELGALDPRRMVAGSTVQDGRIVIAVELLTLPPELHAEAR